MSYSTWRPCPSNVSMFQSRLHGQKQRPAKSKAQKSDVHGSELTMDLPGPPLLSWLPAFHSVFLTVVFIYLWDHFDPSLSSLVGSVLQYDRVQNSFASHYRCPWIFTGSAEAEAEAPVLWPPHATSWLIGKDSDAGRDWGQEEKGTTEDEMAGWHHWLDGRESGWTPGVGDGQGGLACCNSWGCKELDTTEWLNWTELNWIW